MDRPTRDEMFLAQACVTSLRSTCLRLKVGCIVTDEEGTQIVSIGYNGNARGLTNRCDSKEPGKCGCIHAEENALIKAPYNAGNLTLYTTHSPCVGCAKLILNSRITKVVWATEYRDLAGIGLLRAASIDVALNASADSPADLVLRAAMGLVEWESQGRNVALTALVGGFRTTITRP